MVGNDIIEVSRIKKLIKEKGDKFLNRIYTQREIDYCESKGPNKYQHYAGRFAAKEAIIKAWKTTNYNFKKIEIINDKDGVPKVEILTKYNNIFTIEVSISHIKAYATAFALIHKGESTVLSSSLNTLPKA